MTKLGHDVVIAGAGPAGSHLAIRIARAGFSVALLDRRTFPRAKPCGEFMSPECIPLLEDVGLGSAVAAHGVRRIGGLRLHGFGRSAEGRFATFGGMAASHDHGYALRREVLDTLSLDRARATPGVTVYEGHGVTGLVRDAAGRVFGVEAVDPGRNPVTFTARFTVGADGVRSRVAHCLGVTRPLLWLDKFALVARFDGVPDTNVADVAFFERGYLAGAPVDGGEYTLNLVVDRASLPKGGRAALEDLFFSRVGAAPVFASRLARERTTGPLIGCGPLAARTTRQVFDGAALVGDACGYVDPVTGEGLYFAMRGAELLATPLLGALHAGRTDARALVGYVRARRRHLAPRFLLGKLLQRGMRHPAVVKGFLGVLQARPRLADLLVATTGDYLGPADLLRPAVLADVWSALCRGTRDPGYPRRGSATP